MKPDGTWLLPSCKILIFIDESTGPSLTLRSTLNPSHAATHRVSRAINPHTAKLPIVKPSIAKPRTLLFRFHFQSRLRFHPSPTNFRFHSAGTILDSGLNIPTLPRSIPSFPSDLICAPSPSHPISASLFSVSTSLPISSQLQSSSANIPARFC